MASAVCQGQTILLQARQTYNANGQLTRQTWQMGSQSYSEIYTYNKTTGAVATVTTGNGHQLTVVYDSLQRPTKIDGPGLDRNYTYRNISGTQTTSQITSLWYGSTEASAPYRYTYSYNSLGNIASYGDGTYTTSYTYDSLGQLLTATGGSQNYAYFYISSGKCKLYGSDSGHSFYRSSCNPGNHFGFRGFLLV